MINDITIIIITYKSEKIIYDFDHDFNTLFDSSPPFKDIKNPSFPSREEKSCVNDFYNKEVEKKPLS